MSDVLLRLPFADKQREQLEAIGCTIEIVVSSKFVKVTPPVNWVLVNYHNLLLWIDPENRPRAVFFQDAGRVYVMFGVLPAETWTVEEVETDTTLALKVTFADGVVWRTQTYSFRPHLDGNGEDGYAEARSIATAELTEKLVPLPWA